MSSCPLRVLVLTHAPSFHSDLPPWLITTDPRRGLTDPRTTRKATECQKASEELASPTLPATWL